MRFEFALVLVLAGCQSATQRCKKINEQDFMHQATRENEDDLLRRIDKLGLLEKYVSAAPEEQAKIRAQAGEEPNPFRDSTDPRVTAPPRPSDQAWYQEHCYEGKPRD